MNEEVSRQRAALIQKALEAPKGGSDEKKGGRGWRYEDESDHYSCHDDHVGGGGH